MERLGDYTNKLLRMRLREAAWQRVLEMRDPRAPKRFINGIVVSTRAPNSHGDAYEAMGFHAVVPNILLLEHDYTFPLGQIMAAEARGSEVHFTAEVANVRGPYWVDQIWPRIVSREVTSISMRSRNLAPYRQSVFTDWTMEEISVVDQGADRGARITGVWEQDQVVHLDGRSSRKVFWSER